MSLGLRPRDFIETVDGLIFAVLDPLPEEGKILCWLRYQRTVGSDRPRKLETAAAVDLLASVYPGFQHQSSRLGAAVHAVPIERVLRKHFAVKRSAALMRVQPADAFESRAQRLLAYFHQGGVAAAELGVTGSLLIDAQTANSDLDLVSYTRPVFARLRDLVRRGQYDGTFSDLGEIQWYRAWERRGRPLSFADYLWHERRKGNVALFEGTKCDITLANAHCPTTPTARKLGPHRLRCRVSDADAAYDYPARYHIDDPLVDEIFVFTQTYVGQALTGELVDATGQLELDASGRYRLVIGSSREAPGEFLRVVEPRS